MEFLLHYLWYFGKFTMLEGVDALFGSNIEVLNPGIPNSDAGPDFIDAKIKIDNLIWVGNVELHQKSSDWFVHHHEHDPNYQSIILHVVAYCDKQGIKSQQGYILPTCIIHYDKAMTDSYDLWINQQTPMRCYSKLGTLSNQLIEQWKDKLYEEHISKKEYEIKQLVAQYNGHYSEVLYIKLMRYFGFRLNNEAMEEVATSLPWKILQKHSDNLLQLEALLLGQAHLLSSNISDHPYVLALKSEYDFLRKMYGLNPIREGAMRFLRIRPQSFPTRRLAQVAAIFHRTHLLSDCVLMVKSVNDFYNILDIDMSNYWQNHYTLYDMPTQKVLSSKLSQSSMNMIISNVFVPYRYAVERALGKIETSLQTLHFLDQLPMEKNKITKMMPHHICVHKNSKESQSLLYLYNNYCLKKKCMFCDWGRMLLQSY